MKITSLSLWAVMGWLCLAGGEVFADELGLNSPGVRRPGFSAYVLTTLAAEDAAEAATEPATKPTTESEGEDVRPADEPAALDEEPLPEARVKTPLSPEMEALQARIDQTLQYYYDRPENVAQRSVWGVMHALIAYGVDTEVIAGDRKVNAIGWICYNGSCRGERLFHLDRGQLTPRQGPGLQGHGGQFLAMLAQSRVKRDFPIRVDGREFTVEDLIEYEKRTCYSKTELTFKLIGLAHYLPSDATWRNDRGELWSIPRLIQEELAQPIVGAACGGTHRLTGFSYAVNKRKARGEEFTGEWERARLFEESYLEYLMKLRNPEGSFSTQWFAGRGDQGDDKRKLETTGHMTEWMVYALPKDQLSDPQVVETVRFLNDLLWRNRNNDLGIGPRGHALHALVIYQERMFNVPPGHRSLKLATERRQSGK